jgi:hypothetical protein
LTKNFDEILHKMIDEGLSEVGESVTQWVRFRVVNCSKEYVMFPDNRFLKRKKSRQQRS